MCYFILIRLCFYFHKINPVLYWIKCNLDNCVFRISCVPAPRSKKWKLAKRKSNVKFQTKFRASIMSLVSQNIIPWFTFSKLMSVWKTGNEISFLAHSQGGRFRYRSTTGFLKIMKFVKNAWTFLCSFKFLATLPRYSQLLLLSMSIILCV